MSFSLSLRTPIVKCHTRRIIIHFVGSCGAAICPELDEKRKCSKLPQLLRKARYFAVIPHVLLLPMATTFLYRCPNTAQTVQGWSAEEINDDENACESVACLACTQMHLVILKTNKVLGAEEED